MASEAQVDLLISTANALPQLERDLNRIIQTAEANAPDIDIDVEFHVDEDSFRRFDDRARSLREGLTGALPSIAKWTSAVVGVGVAAGGAVPLVAGLATAVAEVAPAAALAASGMLTMQLAAGTLKLALIGVGDAVQLAFDPETKPEELAKAMERLAPNARQFVTELSSMRKQLVGVQQSVQNDFFAGLADDLRALSQSVLPEVATALRSTAVELNTMARGAAFSANELAQSGTLGRALTSATAALGNLTTLPGAVVTSLGTLAAAAGPAFERVTAAAGRAGNRITDELLTAFESGDLEDSINGAVDSLASLGRSLGNVLAGLRTAFSVSAQGGQDFFATLETITAAFRNLTATKGFQQALTSLSQTFSAIGSTVLPLVSKALQLLGPIFAELGPPIQLVVGVLGEALSGVLDALGPVLVSLAKAFGDLIIALSPLITLAGELISALLPALIPLFEAFSKVLEVVAPFVKALADILAAVLVPILEGLAPIVEALLIPFVELYTTVLPEVTRVLEELQPAFVEIGTALGEVVAAAAPVIAEFITMAIAVAKELAPTIQPLVDLLVTLTTVALKGLASFLTEFVVPALKIVAALFRGDYASAIRGSQELTEKWQQKSLDLITRFQEGAEDLFNQFSLQALQKVQEVKEGIQRRLGELVIDAASTLSKLPGEIQDAVGDTGSLLFSAGVGVIQGFVNGIQSQVGSLLATARGIANSITDTISSVLDMHSPSKVTEKQGEDAGKGLENGLRKSKKGVKDAADEVGRTVGEVLGNRTAAALDQITTYFDKAGNEIKFFTGEIVNSMREASDTSAAVDRFIKKMNEGFGLAVGEVAGRRVSAALVEITSLFDKAGNKIEITTGNMRQAIDAVGDSMKTLEERIKDFSGGFGLTEGERIPGLPFADDVEIVRGPGGLPPLPTFENEGTRVVNVFVDGKFIEQRIDDRLRVSQSQQSRRVTQGVRV